MIINHFNTNSNLGQGNNKRASLKKGSLLIEVLISLCVISLLILVISYYRSFIVQWQQQAIKRHEAISLAQSVFADIIGGSHSPIGGTIQHNEFSIIWQGKKKKISSKQFDAHVIMINLDVSWHENTWTRRIAFNTAIPL